MTHGTDAKQAHPHLDELKNDDGSWKYTNRLVHETSPYLLQHAHNPVDWYAWGDAAFEAARAEGKPIFLSVGYATCYWCHVMERQVFENVELAQRMNAHCINIKVDREERPDVDELYMTATQLMTGHGGWPMSTFLTPPGAKDGDDPGLRPFWAGTYIPPEPMRGMPGFGQLVEGIADAWRNRRQEVLDQADRVAEAAREELRNRDTSGALNADMVGQAASALLRRYDRENGGFGDAPKFPEPGNLRFLLAVWRNNGDADLREALRHTLDRMARGGVYDQIGGGFHRYSTDAQWLVPHFEKMLYDNGQLAETYAEAHALALSEQDAALHERIARGICDYVIREMTSDTGAFWSAQDAEVSGREGGNYIWTRRQVEQALQDDQLCELALTMYGLDRGTNFQDPHVPEAEPANVLFLPRPLAELARERGESIDALREKRESIDATLKAARDQREQPTTDDKVLTGWNGLMIAGLARVGRAFGEARYVDAAARAAEAIASHMADDAGGLKRSMRAGEVKIPALLEYYTFFVHGLIELHRATTGDRSARFLALARQYTQSASDRFAAEQGGYYDTLADQSDLFVRIRSVRDGVIPSGNSQMCQNLLDLHALTGDNAYLDRVSGDLRSFGQLLEQRGIMLVHMEHALLRALEMAPQHVQQAEQPSPGADAKPAGEAPVSVSVTPSHIDLSDGQATVRVTLLIDSRYHINAHEPGDPNLIGTELTLQGGPGLSMAVDYPDGTSRQLPFADTRIAVYEGELTLTATLHRTDATGGANAEVSPRLMLRYQPCTDRECLPPQTMELPVRFEGVARG